MMKPNRVPDDLLTAGSDAIKAWYAAHPSSNSYLDDRTRMRIVLAAALTLHDQRAEQRLRTEYGARVTYADTLTAEGPIADTLDEALEALAAFDAKGHANVVSRALIAFTGGDWREVAETECGDVYHRYDDDPLTCTLNEGHIGDHCGQGAEWGVGHEHGDRSKTAQQAEDGDRSKTAQQAEDGDRG